MVWLAVLLGVVTLVVNVANEIKLRRIKRLLDELERSHATEV